MGCWQNIKNWILEKCGIKTIIKNQELSHRMQMEMQAATTFTNVIQSAEWLKYKAFFPGRWAVEYTFLLTLFRILDFCQFKNMLEFGLGQTSRMIHQYANFYKIPAITVEHDADWVDFTKNSIHEAYQIDVKLLPLEMVKIKGFLTRTYQGFASAFKDEKYDFILVDGPFGSEHYSRSQIISLAEHNFAETFCIIIDDCNRVGEQETVKELELVLKKNDVDFAINKYEGLSDYVVICSKNLKFLTSL